MMVDLEERVSQLEKWSDGKGLIVQGAAGTFCSGSDLNAVRAISNPQVGKSEKKPHSTSCAVPTCVTTSVCPKNLFSFIQHIMLVLQTWDT